MVKQVSTGLVKGGFSEKVGEELSKTSQNAEKCTQIRLFSGFFGAFRLKILIAEIFPTTF